VASFGLKVFFALFLLITPLTLADSALAEDKPKIAGDHETRASNRMDLRYRYREVPKNKEDHQVSVRYDFPYHFNDDLFLNNGVSTAAWRLNNQTSPDNRDGGYSGGSGDTTLQSFLVTVQDKNRFDVGSNLIMPTASQDQLGDGRWQLGPTLSYSRDFYDIGEGSFAGLTLRNLFSFAESNGRSDINRLIVIPSFRLNLPDQWHVRLQSESQMNYEQSNDWFVPVSVRMGKNFGPYYASVEVSAPVVDDYERYDQEIEFRIGRNL
jgi:hypothetical protein